MREANRDRTATGTLPSEGTLPAAENDALHRELASNRAGRIAMDLEMDTAARAPKEATKDPPGFEQIGPLPGDPPNVIRSCD